MRSMCNLASDTYVLKCTYDECVFYGCGSGVCLAGSLPPERARCAQAGLFPPECLSLIRHRRCDSSPAWRSGHLSYSTRFGRELRTYTYVRVPVDIYSRLSMSNTPLEWSHELKDARVRVRRKVSRTVLGVKYVGRMAMWCTGAWCFVT